jgi:hypothetical protein
MEKDLNIRRLRRTSFDDIFLKKNRNFFNYSSSSTHNYFNLSPALHEFNFSKNNKNLCESIHNNEVNTENPKREKLRKPNYFPTEIKPKQENISKIIVAQMNRKSKTGLKFEQLNENNNSYQSKLGNNFLIKKNILPI